VAEKELVDLGPRGFDSLIMPRVVLRIPMPPGVAVPAQSIPARSARTRRNVSLFGGQKRYRVQTRLKSK